MGQYRGLRAVSGVERTGTGWKRIASTPVPIELLSTQRKSAGGAPGVYPVSAQCLERGR